MSKLHIVGPDKADADFRTMMFDIMQRLIAEEQEQEDSEQARDFMAQAESHMGPGEASAYLAGMWAGKFGYYPEVR